MEVNLAYFVNYVFTLERNETKACEHKEILLKLV